MSLEIVTFGCRLNIYESEVIKGAATEAGLENAMIFNSCAVTQEAERQLRQALRKARRENPKKRIIVTGCAAQVRPQEYANMPEVDQVVGNTEKMQASSYVADTLDSEPVRVNDIMSIKETSEHLMVQGFEGKARAFLQIQNGCNHRCTFCTIPFGRGNSRSVPIAQIAQQAQILVDQGYNELVLTGVDLTDYGSNLPGTPSLGKMIKRLLQYVPGIKRLRLSSIDVAEIDNDLMHLIEHEQRLMPHLHLSLQAGDNLVLRRMKRRHNREQVLDFCAKAREIRSDIVFGADIIAGFPTENDDMFQNTCNLVEEAGLIHLHVFPYSERDGTPATRMPQVEKPIRKRRAAILRELGQKLRQKHYESLVGSKVEVLVERHNLGIARDFSTVKFQEDHQTGSIVDMKIESVEGATLVAA